MKNIKKLNSLKMNFIFNLIKTLMSLIFPLITFPYASKILLSSGIGKVNFADSIIAYFVLIASLGISTYAIREGAKLRDDKEKLSCFCQEILIINSITTIVAYGLLFILITFMPQLYNYKQLLLIFSLTIGCNTIGVEWLYVAMEEYKYISIRAFVINIISLILLFTFVKTPSDYVIYALIQVFASVGANVINFLKIRQFITLKKTQKYNFKRHFKPILIIFGLNIACNIYMNFDKTCLGLITGDASVGLYTAALKVNRIVLALITSLGTVLLPRLTYYLQNKNEIEFNRLIKKAFNFIYMFSIPAAIGLFLLSDPIIHLLSGDSFINASATMKILTLIIPIIGVSNLIAVQIFIPLGKEKYTLISSSVAATINLILNLILIPNLSQNGAAIGTVIAELSALITCYLFSKRLINLKGVSRYFYQYLLGSFSIIVLYYMLNIFVKSQNLLMLLTVTFGIILYFTSLLLFKNEYIINFYQSLKEKIKNLKEKKI